MSGLVALRRHLRAGFLEGAPVQPLGTYAGYLFLQDCSGERHALEPDELTPLQIVAVFGPAIGWLTRLSPRHDQSGEPDGWDADLAAESLIVACAHVGTVGPLRLGFAIGRYDSGAEFIQGPRARVTA